MSNKENSERDRPAYTPVYCISPEQKHFLGGIERRAREVLDALGESVLSPFTSAVASGSDLPVIDPSTWSAFWTWAAKFHLVQETELPWLNSAEAVAMVREMADYVPPGNSDQSPLKPAPGCPYAPFALVVLTPTAFQTLSAWLKDGVPDEPAWVFPPPPLAINFHLLSAPTNQRRPYFPFFYGFDQMAPWRPHLESRQAYERRAMDTLRSQLREQMDESERLAGRFCRKNRRSICSKAHADWLTLFQVKGMEYIDIARDLIKTKTWNNPDTTEDALAETVRTGIQKMAELVIGPAYGSWLRPPRFGRPPK
jgi:hypothetical protein